MATWSKLFSFFTWKNRPDTSTPLGQTLLNRLNTALNGIDDRVITLNAEKVSVDEMQAFFTDVRLVKNTGQFVFTLYDGTEKIIDTALEKISINVSFDQNSQMLVLEKEDGSIEYVDLSAFTTQYEFASSPTIQQTVTDGKVRADIKPNSITDQMLQTNYLADITTQANTALSASQSALESQFLAEQYAEEAKEQADRAEAAADRAESVSAVDIATTEKAGIVKPDGTTITVDSDGTIHGNASVTVDTELDADSTNPIANKAVAEALENVENVIGVTPQMFGAKGDGVTDDTQAFLYLAIYANGRDYTYISIPEGHYIINGQIIFNRNVDIIGSGNGAILDFSGYSESNEDNSCILITGNEPVELPVLGSDVVKGSLFVTLSEAYPLNKGDIFSICDTVDGSWESSRVYYHKGEFVQVADMTDNVVTTSNVLYDDYTASNCVVYKLNTITGSVKNLTLIGCHVNDEQSDKAILKVKFGKDFLVEGVHGSNTNYIVVEFDRSYHVDASNVYVNTREFPSIGLNYGIAICNTMFATVSNCHTNTTRHGITTGGGDNLQAIVNRGCVYANNVCTCDDIYGAIDTHDNCEDITIANNNVTGLAIAGKNIVVNNNIVTCKDCAIMITRGMGCVISNNKIKSFIAGNNFDGAITIKSNSKEGYTFKVIGNTIESVGQCIRLVSSNDNTDTYIIENNTMISTDSANAVYSNNKDKKVVFRFNTCRGGLFIVNSLEVVAEGNVITDCKEACIGFNGSEKVIIKENNLNSYGLRPLILTVNVTNLLCKNNVLYGSCPDSSSSSAYLSSAFISATNAVIVGNDIDVGENEKALYAIFLSNVVDLTFYDNNITGLKQTIQNLPTTYYGETTGSNKKIVFSNAIPTNGKYGVGSICYNTAPSSGNPVGWVCTVAGEGTSATWKPFATI